MQVTFLNPASTDDAFYRDMVALMEIGARSLQLELEVIECHRDLGRMTAEAERVAARPRKPSAAIVVNDRSAANAMIPCLSGAGISTLLVCEGLMLPDRQLLGSPGELHRSWVGELLPDDLDAGEQLARHLVQAAARARLVGRDGKIHVAGLGGSYTSAAILRLTGLRRGMDADPRAVLGHVAPAGWSRSMARKETLRLLEDDPDISVIWAANDAMALGAAEAVAEMGRAPGGDVVVGGIDWSPAAIEEVQKRRLAASVGGHFADGLWALVWLHDLLHDRHVGATALKSKMVTITAQNAGTYLPVLDHSRWGRLDVRRLTGSSRGESVAMAPGIEPLLALLGDASSR